MQNTQYGGHSPNDIQKTQLLKLYPSERYLSGLAATHSSANISLKGPIQNKTLSKYGNNGISRVCNSLSPPFHLTPLLFRFLASLSNAGQEVVKSALSPLPRNNKQATRYKRIEVKRHTGARPR